MIMTNIRADYINSNMGLVVKIAQVYMTTYGLDADDLIQAGTEGLITAVDKFKPELGFKFSSYAYPYIKYFIINTINKEKKDRPDGMLSLDCKYCEEDTLLDLLVDENADVVNDCYIGEVLQLVIRIASETDKRGKDIIFKHYGLDGGLGETLEEVGESYNLTRERIRQIKRNILKKVKTKLLVQERK